MKKWILPVMIALVFIGMTILFLTPSYSFHCTEKLLVCMENNISLGFWEKIWGTLVCVCHNVLCVLGGLFV